MLPRQHTVRDLVLLIVKILVPADWSRHGFVTLSNEVPRKPENIVKPILQSNIHCQPQIIGEIPPRNVLKARECKLIHLRNSGKVSWQNSMQQVDSDLP